MSRACKIVILAIAFVAISPALLRAGQFKVTWIEDGDTIIAEGSDIQIKVRLVGKMRQTIPVCLMQLRPETTWPG